MTPRYHVHYEGPTTSITEDPNGVAFDVIKPIPLSPEFAKQFAAAP